MRQKAETLQYRKNQSPFSKKQQYGRISSTKYGSFFYSSRDVLQRLEAGLNCPSLDLIVTPPTNSGVRDYKFKGYYLDTRIPLRLVNNNLNA